MELHVGSLREIEYANQLAVVEPCDGAHLADAGNDPQRRLVEGSGHDLAEASDDLIGELAGDLAARIIPVELPPVLVAIEEMGDGVR